MDGRSGDERFVFPTTNSDFRNPTPNLDYPTLNHSFSSMYFGSDPVAYYEYPIYRVYNPCTNQILPNNSTINNLYPIYQGGRQVFSNNHTEIQRFPYNQPASYRFLNNQSDRLSIFNNQVANPGFSTNEVSMQRFTSNQSAIHGFQSNQAESWGMQKIEVANIGSPNIQSVSQGFISDVATNQGFSCYYSKSQNFPSNEVANQEFLDNETVTQAQLYNESAFLQVTNNPAREHIVSNIQSTPMIYSFPGNRAEEFQFESNEAGATSHGYYFNDGVECKQIPTDRGRNNITRSNLDANIRPNDSKTPDKSFANDSTHLRSRMKSPRRNKTSEIERARRSPTYFQRPKYRNADSDREIRGLLTTENQDTVLYCKENPNEVYSIIQRRKSESEKYNVDRNIQQIFDVVKSTDIQPIDAKQTDSHLFDIRGKPSQFLHEDLSLSKKPINQIIDVEEPFKNTTEFRFKTNLPLFHKRNEKQKTLSNIHFDPNRRTSEQNFAQRHTGAIPKTNIYNKKTETKRMAKKKNQKKNIPEIIIDEHIDIEEVTNKSFSSAVYGRTLPLKTVDIPTTSAMFESIDKQSKQERNVPQSIIDHHTDTKEFANKSYTSAKSVRSANTPLSTIDFPTALTMFECINEQNLEEENMQEIVIDDIDAEEVTNKPSSSAIDVRRTTLPLSTVDIPTVSAMFERIGRQNKQETNVRSQDSMPENMDHLYASNRESKRQQKLTPEKYIHKDSLYEYRYNEIKSPKRHGLVDDLVFPENFERKSVAQVLNYNQIDSQNPRKRFDRQYSFEKEMNQCIASQPHTFNPYELESSVDNIALISRLFPNQQRMENVERKKGKDKINLPNSGNEKPIETSIEKLKSTLPVYKKNKNQKPKCKDTIDEIERFINNSIEPQGLNNESEAQGSFQPPSDTFKERPTGFIDNLISLQDIFGPYDYSMPRKSGNKDVDTSDNYDKTD